jgi:hypothetical protein
LREIDRRAPYAKTTAASLRLAVSCRHVSSIVALHLSTICDDRAIGLHGPRVWILSDRPEEAIMAMRANAAIRTVLLIGVCLGSESTSALPVAPAPLIGGLLSAIQYVGWNCGPYRCRWRPRQIGIRIIERRNAQEFLNQISSYLNCCNPSIVPFYGYTYGPVISFDYGPPAIAPPSFRI